VFHPTCLTHIVDLGHLLNVGTVAGKGIEATLAACRLMSDTHIAMAASFIHACLRLDPSERATAEELEQHEWVTHSTCNYH
jgi:serine/threonine-protein kinase SRPK3